MNRQIKGLLYFFIADVRYSLFIFWTILMSIVAVSLVITYFLKDVEDAFWTLSLTGPMYIYCAILGFLTVKESIPFAIKMGATRKNLFLSLGTFFLALSAIKAIVASTIQVLIDGLNTVLGLQHFSFIHLVYFLDDTWLNRVVVDTSMMFFFLSSLFVIGLLFYKYGLAGGGTVVGLLVLVLLTGLANGWLIDFFTGVFQAFSMTFFYQLFIIGLIIYCISIILIRKITVVKVR